MIAGGRPSLRGVLLAALSGGLLASLGYAQPQLAWFAFVPLLVAVHGRPLHAAAGLGLLAGWLFEAGTTIWFLGAGVSLPAWLLLSFVCALRFAVLGALAAPALGAWRLLALPGAWVLLEYLRLHQGPFSAAWGLIGYSQASFLPAARLAAWGGVYGVSFAIVAVNVALAELVGPLLRARGGGTWLRAAAPSLGLLALVALLVASRASAPSLETAPGERALQLVAVQGGAREDAGDQAERVRLVERYRSLSRAAATPPPDLVVWPEASVPAAIPADAGALRAVATIANELRAPLLLAASGADKTQRGRPGPGRAAANSAFLVDPSGRVRGRYDKVRLLPFNEYVPLRGVVRWPEWIVSDGVDAVPGRERTGFELDGYRFAVLICWENLFPHDFREASAGADFVVSLTNEAFTQSSVAHRQLLDMNRFRAIENGVWIARAAATAESAGIAPSGELVARLAGPEGNGAAALGTVSLRFAPGARATLYHRHGDWLVALQAVLLAAIVAGHLVRRARATR